MEHRNINVAELARRASMDNRAVEAVVMSRYTTSPEQRARIAQALGITEAEIRWGHALDVDHMYGHGPQFGRSP